MGLWRSAAAQHTRAVLPQSTSLNGLKKKKKSKNYQKKKGRIFSVSATQLWTMVLHLYIFFLCPEASKISVELYSQLTKGILLFILFSLFIHEPQHD